LQLRDKAQSISERMGKSFHTQALIGIGSILPEGEGLNPSCQEALLALQWAIHQNKKVIFYDAIEPSEIEPRVKGKAWPDAQGLVEVSLRDSKAEKAAVLDQYLRDVIHHTAGRADLVRVHLVSVLSLYGAQMEKKLSLPPSRLSGTLGDWISRLEKARAAHELIAVFKEALGVFGKFSQDPSAAEWAATLKDLKAY